MNELILSQIEGGVSEELELLGRAFNREYIFDNYKPLGETVELEGWHPNEKRKLTLQQFFTPYSVVKFITEALNLYECDKAIVLDNSTGIGRMFRYLHPGTRIVGIEIEENAYKVAKALFPHAELVKGNLIDYILPTNSVDVSLLNPPFSIQLEKRNSGIHNAQWGAMGFRSSVLSHIAALEIAIRATDYFVACVLPASFFTNETTRTFEKWIKGRANEVLRVELPRDIYKGADWDTTLIIYSTRQYWYKPDPLRFKVKDIAELETVLEQWRATEYYQKYIAQYPEYIREYPKVNVKLKEREQFELPPVKDPTLPRTGKPTVKVCINPVNTGMLLKTDNLLTTLKVQEYKRLLGQRYNNATKDYIPEWWIKARRPVAFYKSDTLSMVSRALMHLDIEVDPQLLNISKKLKRWLERHKTPFEQWVITKNGIWEEMFKKEGICAKYPKLYQHQKKKLDRVLTKHPNLTLWEWQKHDVIRISMKQHALLATDMGLGKTRMSIALALLHGCKHTLIVTEAKLIGQFAGELKMFGCELKVINEYHDTKNLKQFNLIAYSKLWRKATKGKTFAKSLKKQCNCVILDEAHAIKANDSRRALACRSMHPKHWLLMSGTPIANYPRNIFSLLVCGFGDGTELFEYGYYTPYIDDYGATSGTRKFRENFVTVDTYISHQFDQTLDKGRRTREFPIVKDINLWHLMLAPLMIRRCRDEPEVMKAIKIPEPIIKDIWVNPTAEHVEYYQKWLDQFAEWFLSELKKEAEGDHKMDMIMLLVQIGKLQFASTIPQSKKIKSDKKIAFNWNGNLTRKQEEVLKLATEYAHQRKKIIIYSERPELQYLLAEHLRKRGIKGLVFTGEQPIQKREEILKDFKLDGNYPVLLATTTVGGTGLNLPQASVIIFADQSWTPAIHEQAIARVCRPQQRETPLVFKLFHSGFIDEYMKQMMDVKKEGIDEAVDWQAHTFDPSKWLDFRDMSYRYLKEAGYIK